MKRSIFATGVVTIGILFSTCSADAAGIKEGKWSMTTVIKMDGMDNQAAEAMKEMEHMSPEDKAMMQKMMGGMKIGGAGAGMGMSTTITQCLTNNNPVPEASHQENCQQTHTVKGNTVNFDVVCSNSHSSGQVTYKNDTMNGTIKSTQTDHGQEKTNVINISGTYVGPCDQHNANNARGKSHSSH